MKNEVLFNIRRHPLTRLSQIERRDWPAMAQAVKKYGWNFYKWKKNYELRKHWQVYSKGTCPLCQGPIKRQHLGKFPRRTFWCPVDQKRRLKRSPLAVYDVLPIRSFSENLA
jgi:endonuclease-8